MEEEYYYVFFKIYTESGFNCCNFIKWPIKITYTFKCTILFDAYLFKMKTAIVTVITAAVLSFNSMIFIVPQSFENPTYFYLRKVGPYH